MNQYRKSKLRPFEKMNDREAPPTILETRERYAWNTHILQKINKNLAAQEFILPIICGYFQSQIIEIKEKQMHVGIISRRSRFNAGPRFLRRGIDVHGNPANEVESEFFVYEMIPMECKIKRFSSYLMVILT